MLRKFSRHLFLLLLMLFSLVFLSFISFTQKIMSETQPSEKWKRNQPLKKNEIRNFDLLPGESPGQLPEEIVPRKFPTNYSFPVGMMNHLKFRYIENHRHICTDQYKQPSVLICVFSDPLHFRSRMFIRDTWGDKSTLEQLNTALAFFAGNSTNIYGRNFVKWENAKFSDVVQENYYDSYKNLSYKGISALRWIERYCPSVKYVVKVDDDVLVNVYNLIRFLKRIFKSSTPYPMSFFCKPTRWVNFTGKLESSASTRILNYCLGKVFILPRGAVWKLYNATFFSPFNMVNNIYITGLLAQTANITHIDIGNYYVTNPQFTKDKLIYGEAIFGHLGGDTKKINGTEIMEKINEIENAIL